MMHLKWQRLCLVVMLSLAVLYQASAAAAAPRADPSCLQSLKEALGTVLPGSASPNQPTQCDPTGSAGIGLIPITGAADSSVSWSDVGAGVSLTSSGSWRDAGAGVR